MSISELGSKTQNWRLEDQCRLTVYSLEGEEMRWWETMAS
jgi:hypothetical protein